MTALAEMPAGRRNPSEDNSMLTIRPVGSAAWVRVRPSIRVAGEADTRGCLRHLSNRVAEPTGFLYARIGLSAGLLVGPASFRSAREYQSCTWIRRLRSEKILTARRLSSVRRAGTASSTMDRKHLSASTVSY